MRKKLIMVLILAISIVFVSCRDDINAIEEDDRVLIKPIHITEQPKPTKLTEKQQLVADMQWLNEAEEDPVVINLVSEKATVLSNGDMLFIQDNSEGNAIWYLEEGESSSYKVYQSEQYIYDIVSTQSDEVFFAATGGLFQYLSKNEARLISISETVSHAEIFCCTDEEVVFIEHLGYDEDELVVKYDLFEKTCTQLLEFENIRIPNNGGINNITYLASAPLIDVWDYIVWVDIDNPYESCEWDRYLYSLYLSADSKHAIIHDEQSNRMDIINFETKKKISIEDCNPELSDAIDQYFVLKDMDIIFFEGNLVYHYNLMTQDIEVIYTLDLSGDDIFYHGFDQGIMDKNSGIVYWDILEEVAGDEEDINQNDDWWIVAYDIEANEITVLEHHDERPYEWTDGPNWNYFWERWRDRIVLLSYESGGPDFDIEYEVFNNQEQ